MTQARRSVRFLERADEAKLPCRFSARKGVTLTELGDIDSEGERHSPVDCFRPWGIDCESLVTKIDAFRSGNSD